MKHTYTLFIKHYSWPTITNLHAFGYRIISVHGVTAGYEVEAWMPKEN